MFMEISLWKIKYQEKYTDWKRCHIKHLMTGSKGDSEFCFFETRNVPSHLKPQKTVKKLFALCWRAQAIAAVSGSMT